jgi:uncharacterized protein (TIGR02147 family)
MKQESIFDFSDYKAYLDWKIRSMPAGGRGFRSKLAEHIRSQKAFVSQVLKGEAHFNLEHADSINHLLHHDREESRYFLLLIQEIRAGTQSLREFFQSQRMEILNSRLLLKNRLKSEEQISEEHKGKYYSSWIYGAIRVGLTIPRLRRRESLMTALGIKEEQFLEAIAFLEAAGFIERKGEEYLPTKTHLHIGHDHSLIVRHHTNWRLRTMDALARSNPEELHYSAVVSLSKKDMQKIRSILVTAVEKSMEVIKESPEEELCVICADLFPIT